jgi:HSP20 family protein
MRYRIVTYRYNDGSRQQLDRHYRQLWQDALRQQSMGQRSITWRPLADIQESAERMTVKVELAGMAEDQIEVTLYADALVVSGERKDNHQSDSSLAYYEAQIRYGPFRLEVFLPTPIQQDGVTASYNNGFLLVELPKVTG